MPNDGPGSGPSALVVACLRVHDDLEDLTFDLNLEDVVRAIDDPHQPGAHRQLITTLLNAAILDRHPHAAGFGSRPLPVRRGVQ